MVHSFFVGTAVEVHCGRRKSALISSYQSISCPGGLLSSSFHSDQENQGSRADLVAEAVARMQGIGALEVVLWMRDIGIAGTRTRAADADR